jgi:hypothetical protein
MGHDSPQAASIYQHATAETDRAIAQTLHEAMSEDRMTSKKPAGSTGKTKDKPGNKSGGKKGTMRSAGREGAGDGRGYSSPPRGTCGGRSG